jgi:large subunit ribosomal protein L15
MALDNIKPNEGSRHTKWIIGRGNGSGTGKNCGYGDKGAKRREGRGKGYGSGYEGGQTRAYMRLPKIRGWRNELVDPMVVSEIKLGELNIIPAGTEVTMDVLRTYDLARKTDEFYKILGSGTLGHALNFKRAQATKSAVEAIKAVGGTIEMYKKPKLVRVKRTAKQGA